MVEETEETKVRGARKAAKLATCATTEYTDNMLNFLVSPQNKGNKSDRSNKKRIKGNFSSNSLQVIDENSESKQEIKSNKSYMKSKRKTMLKLKSDLSA